MGQATPDIAYLSVSPSPARPSACSSSCSRLNHPCGQFRACSPSSPMSHTEPRTCASTPIVCVLCDRAGGSSRARDLTRSGTPPLETVPELGRSAPSVLRARGELIRARIESTSTGRRRSSSTNTTSSSQTLARATEAYLHARARATGETSSRAIAYGYAAGIGVLVTLLPIMSWLSSTSASGPAEERDGTWPLRVAVAISGLWWLVGTAFAAVWLRPRHEPTPSLSKADRSHSYGAAIAQGWRGLGQMLGEWRRLPQAFVFLTSWFFLSDCEFRISSHTHMESSFSPIPN